MIEVFNSWRLSRKMLVTFAVIGALMAGIAGTGIYAMTELAAIATRHVERGIAGTEALGRMMTGLRENRVIVFAQMYVNSPEGEARYASRMAKNRAAIEQAMQDYRPLAGEFAPQLDALKAKIDRLDTVDARIMELRKSQGPAAALPLVQGDGKEASDAASDEARNLVALQQNRARAANDAGQVSASRAFWSVVAMAVLGFACLLVIWRLITRTVSNPMAQLADATTALAQGGEANVPHRERSDELGDVANAVEQFRIAAVDRAEADARAAAAQQVVTSTLRDGLAALSRGDLTAEIHAEFPADYAALKANFNDALASLSTLIAAVTESTAGIRSGAGEIAQASDDLARRTETNAASLEETAAAIMQIDGRLRATAGSAGRTVERADGAIATVAGGRSTANAAVEAMTRVSESAKGIDDVIEGLDKIAFQTRVLAMNAAVEAGRAGEAGRGFAVVADLVSALAMRAEEEAGRARDQLTATQTDIVSAVEMVQKVDNALAAIAGDVSEVHGLLGAMAADNQAQSTAITQISAAIGAMDQSTQQNAAMVEQTSAAARNLSNEVSTLSGQTTMFKVSAASPRAFRPQIVRSHREEPAGLAVPSGARVGGTGRQDQHGWTEF
ncbi:methyl-accepting chemotaxis protein (plasmid) [Novosphingobium sp. BL-8A]|uniref:methyl-accepting chemotaxis protein n=1 Tax=Novosphingobium sp. BL-8A TaxID=3127639 RepID=UPI0037574504